MEVFEQRIQLRWLGNNMAFIYDNADTRIFDFTDLGEDRKVIGTLGKLIIHEIAAENRRKTSKIFNEFTSIGEMILYGATMVDLPGSNLLSTLKVLTIKEGCTILKSRGFQNMKKLSVINIETHQNNINVGAIVQLFSAYDESPPTAVVCYDNLGLILKALAGKGSSFKRKATIKIHGITIKINRIENTLQLVISRKVNRNFPASFMPFIDIDIFDRTEVLYEDKYRHFHKYWLPFLKKFGLKITTRRWKVDKNGKLELYPEIKSEKDVNLPNSSESSEQQEAELGNAGEQKAEPENTEKQKIEPGTKKDDNKIPEECDGEKSKIQHHSAVMPSETHA